MNKTELKRIVLLGGLAFLGVSASDVKAQVAEDVDIMMRSADSTFRGGGFDRLEMPRRYALKRGYHVEYTYTLEASRQYLFSGVCDRNCGNLDLRVLDIDGNELAIDNDDDAVPLIRFTPKVTGQYLLDVTMITCAADTCSYALSAYK